MQSTQKTSLRKAESNRKNSLLSTGPRTSRGKKQVGQNAVSHGLLAGPENVVLPGEDRDVFDAFKKGLHKDLAPVGEMEALLVDRIISSAWRLRRLQRIELGILAAEFSAAKKNAMYGWNPFKSKTPFGLGAKPEEEIELVAIGLAFRRDSGDDLGRLRRYEVTLERAMYQAIHELERRQKSRTGEVVPAPAVLEIGVAIDESHD